ncbi:MAG: hypothetical protein OXK74_18215, partial [Gemmatimonadota bacterium]|nr:hypothetical protein [Gemmatimonadota bacterium]
MKTRLAAALVAIGMPACQQDSDRADAAPPETPGSAEVRSVDAREEDYPVETWGDLPLSEARDSAGIRIVENASPAEGSRLHWVIGPEPDVSIGDIDGEDPYLLSYAWDATRLSDGRIVVADRSTSELRVFDSDGNFGRSFNRAGASQAPWEVTRPELVRRDGSILGILAERENAGTAEVRILNGEGGLHVSLGDHRSRRALYFSRELKLGLWGDLVVAAPSDRYELRAYADDGTLVRIVRREHVPRVPRAEDILVDPRLRPELRIPMEAEMLRVPQSKLEEAFPAFAEIMSDAAGYLWVREFEGDYTLDLTGFRRMTDDRI